MKRGRFKRKRTKKDAKVDGYEYGVAICTGILLGGVIGFLVYPSWFGSIPGTVIGGLMGLAFPKPFFAIGDAIASALL